MEQVKTQVCDNLTMYAQKYDEDFCSHLPGFVNDVWQLLINTGVQAKYDLVCYQGTVVNGSLCMYFCKIVLDIYKIYHCFHLWGC